MARILIRFDDICPTMNYKQWENAKRLMDKYNIKPLIGVVPNNKDKDLMIDSENPLFWNEIRSLRNAGYVVAMHGYDHVMNTKGRGIVNGSRISEFAGLPYNEQLKKISDGKAIFNREGINVDVFFAPAHSYDKNTLKALKACGFKYLSDGKSLKPIKREGILCVPSLTSGVPTVRRSGDYTVVIHTNAWENSKFNYDRLIELCEQRKTEIMPFYEYASGRQGNLFIGLISEKMYILYEITVRDILRLLRGKLLALKRYRIK